MTSLQSSATRTAIKGIDLAGFTVGEVPKMLAFYRDTLGLQPATEQAYGAEFKLANGAWLGIWKPDETATPSFSVMFAVDDARAAIEFFNSRGAKISEPFESSVCIMGFGEDPDGNRFIIHQRTKHEDPPAPPHTRTESSINGVDLAAFFTGDPQRSIAFYRDVLGMTPTEIDDQGRGAEFTLPDGQTFGVWRPEGGDEGARTSGGAIMFSVDDIAAAVGELRKRGAAISDPEDTGHCYMAFAEDPDGHGVIIHQLKK